MTTTFDPKAFSPESLRLYRCVRCGLESLVSEHLDEQNPTLRCAACGQVYDLVLGVPFLGMYQEEDLLHLLECEWKSNRGPAMAIQKGPTLFIATPTGQASRRPGKASADLPAPRLCGAGLRLPQVELAELPPAKAGAIGNRLLAT